MERSYQNPDVFLVEMLGFPNHCSLRCGYCDWEKEPFSGLDDWELARVRRHLEQARFFIRAHYPQAQVIEYSGGEPYVHPEVVELVLEMFRDYWVRVNTNGQHMTKAAMDALQSHGRAYLALSLDGYSMSANCHRFQNRQQLVRSITALEEAVARKIPVALLCTLHKDNIDEFPAYLSWLEERWPEAIQEGRLMLAAHRISGYGKPRPWPREDQCRRMNQAMQESRSALVAPIREHYLQLWDRDNICGIHKWASSMHFLGDSLGGDGRFTAYRCGMRGIGPVGQFSLPEEMRRDRFSRAMARELQRPFEDYHCQCLVDWRAFDLVFSGVIPMERAAKWFVPFREERVRRWVCGYQSRHKVQKD